MAAALRATAGAAIDPALRLVVDGRSIDARFSHAVLHDGVPFVDVIDGVRGIGGLVRFGPAGSVRVTKAGRTLRFVVGRRTATVDAANVRLPAAPYVSGGEIFVPLAPVATLADATLAIDRRGHRALLALGRGDGFALDSRRPSDAETDDVVPSPTQALTFATSGTIDATGLHARVAIANTTARPYVVRFPSGGSIAFVVSRNGSEVWSSNEAAADAPATTVTVPANGSITVAAQNPGTDRLGPGRYLLRVRLMTLIPIDITPISLGVVVAATP
ncbi:MAG: hypothetical protein NVS2B3_12070 [Vulcanimicrobiaceae bacterium]